jgi:ribonuclease P protein component
VPVVPKDVIVSASEVDASKVEETDRGEKQRPQAKDFRFCRQYRLLTAAQYAEVFAARSTIQGKTFALHYRPNGLAIPRLGLIMAKKHARSAVLRNAIKRQVRELFRSRRCQLPSVDLILRLKQFVPLQVVSDGNASVSTAGDKHMRTAWQVEIGQLLDRLLQKIPV